MHTALQLAPVLAAEKSKLPYYIAGGLLVLWALVLALALGLRRPSFPGSLGGQRAVSAVTIVLVLATLTTAVLTSGGSTKTAAASPARSQAVTTGGSAGAEQAPAGTATAPPAATSTASAGATPATAGAGGHSSLEIAADPTGLLRFDASSLKAKAGTVTITLTNNAQLEHNITIAQGTKVLGATPTFVGGTRTVTLKLAPGRYVFYCSVPGHRQSGMEGTLTVS
jgi:plastocyanin